MCSVFRACKHSLRCRQLNAIPTVGGPSVPLLSYIGAFKFLFRAQELIQSGYDKVWAEAK